MVAYVCKRAGVEIKAVGGTPRSVQIKFGAAVPRDYREVFLDITKIERIDDLPVEFPESPSFFDDWVEVTVLGDRGNESCECVKALTARELSYAH